jgi:transcriptional regulator with XRE-family HTH domain
MNVGQRIKSARIMAGLSMRQLAEQLDLSATAISKFENEKLVPRQSTLLKMARVLGVPLHFFISQEVVEITESAFRKKSGTSKKSQRQIEELVKYNLEKHLQVRQLFAGKRDLSVKVKRNSFKVTS